MRTFTLVIALVVVALVAGPMLRPGGTAEAATTAPTFTRYTAPSTFYEADNAGEPGLGVNWNTNKVHFQAWSDTLIVTFDDTATPPTATWEQKIPLGSGIINVDPVLATDHVTGRVWAGGLDGACSVMSFSDNDGATWTPMGNVCAGAAFDHPTLGSGPWPSNPPPSTYNRAVYYCAQISFVQCATSLDGGLTFGAGVAVSCGYINPGLHGSVHVGPNGVAYLPFKNCGTVNGVGVSQNGGFSWTGRPIPGATAADEGFDPDVATTPDGTAWVAYPTSGNGVGVARTSDAGASWTNFGDVAYAAGIRSATFHEMVAGDNGRAAVAYLGSTTDGNPHGESFGGVWYVYVTYTFDNGASWSTVRADANIVQRGWICAGGTTCDTGRNLLDFIDAQVDNKGRIVIGYADGCINTCETGSGKSDASYASIIRQSGGRTLFAAYD